MVASALQLKRQADSLGATKDIAEYLRTERGNNLLPCIDIPPEAAVSVSLSLLI